MKGERREGKKRGPYLSANVNAHRGCRSNNSRGEDNLGYRGGGGGEKKGHKGLGVVKATAGETVMEGMAMGGDLGGKDGDVLKKPPTKGSLAEKKRSLESTISKKEVTYQKKSVYSKGIVERAIKILGNPHSGFT